MRAFVSIACRSGACRPVRPRPRRQACRKRQAAICISPGLALSVAEAVAPIRANTRVGSATRLLSTRPAEGEDSYRLSAKHGSARAVLPLPQKNVDTQTGAFLGPTYALGLRMKS
ncbi:hypothetical protein MTO96_036570, partial [Rhipicephalus appendiculatus]